MQSTLIANMLQSTSRKAHSPRSLLTSYSSLVHGTHVRKHPSSCSTNIPTAPECVTGTPAATRPLHKLPCPTATEWRYLLH